MLNLEVYLKQLDEACLSGDVEEIKRINDVIVGNINGTIVCNLDEELILSIKNKPVHTNLLKVLKGDVTDSVVAKVLSSLVTHMIIESEVKGRELSKFPVSEMLDLIKDLVSGGKSRGDIVDFLRERFGKFA